MDFYIKVDDDLYLSRVRRNLYFNDKSLDINVGDKFIFQEVDHQNGNYTGHECEKVVASIHDYGITPPLVRFEKQEKQIIKK